MLNSLFVRILSRNELFADASLCPCDFFSDEKFKYLPTVFFLSTYSFFVQYRSFFFLQANSSIQFSHFFPCYCCLSICWYSIIQTLKRDRLVILNRCLIACVLRALNLTKRCLLRFAIFQTTGVSFLPCWGWKTFWRKSMHNIRSKRKRKLKRDR